MQNAERTCANPLDTSTPMRWFDTLPCWDALDVKRSLASILATPPIAPAPPDFCSV